ncbi:2-isopropylmalate synthase [Methylacidimicrobium cyclopophantes]|uniref:Citramalate synthase n=1 Tax=Methylacidimicrobium cyclopophantes TaxID=1041766 RepID=A0A5E6MI13_9BACT|nr:citramalate synthase [Methylacidimicrobium cyclopophantes]VVM05685.1 2-isopropylmalate synthase [Methylacidimicrobium cyclopophantes]
MQHGSDEAVTIYDTTLRDGAQAENVHFSLPDKLRIVRKLDELGIAYIEGGWPGSNPKDLAFFREVSTVPLRASRIVAFGSTRKAGVAVDQDPQIRMLLDAGTKAVAVFGKTWLLHVRKVLRVTPEENLEMIRETIAFLKSCGKEVVYDAEHAFDGYQEDPAYALECLEAASEAGADWVVLCDTNGGSLPEKITELTALAARKISSRIGIHTHNDGELAVANALAAVQAGATQVQGTINGYGERTGNCNLISAIANLEIKMGKRVLPPGALSRLQELSYFVDETANLAPNPRAPFVGRCAFAHKGGTHVNAIGKLFRSYEHIEPEIVGNRRRILVGELSGRSNIVLKAKELGLTLREDDARTREALQQVKEMEGKGYEFEAADASFELLLRKRLLPYPPFFQLVEYHVSIRRFPAKEYEVSEATVKLSVKGETVYTVAEGDGPIHALDQALRGGLERFYPDLARVSLRDYKVRILGPMAGTGAVTRVLVESSDGSISWTTVGVSTNIVEASWEALVDSIEYWLLRLERLAGAPLPKAG